MIRVFIADDNAVIRRGVIGLLETADGIEVVGEAGDGREAVRRVRELRPDAVLLDIRMPVMDGIAAAEALSEEFRVLMLTYAEDGERVAAAIRAGAAGYLVHGRFEPDELERSIRDLVAGRTVLSPAVAPAVFEAIRRGPEGERGEFVDELTEREREIMNLVARGRSNRDIAAELVISEKTVKNHVNHIYAKLGASARAEAIAIWLGSADESRA